MSVNTLLHVGPATWFKLMSFAFKWWAPQFWLMKFGMPSIQERELLGPRFFIISSLPSSLQPSFNTALPLPYKSRHILLPQKSHCLHLIFNAAPPLGPISLFAQHF